MKTSNIIPVSFPDAGPRAAPLDGPGPAFAPLPEPAITASPSSDVRLIIEEDEASGSFIYKTLDRRTGEIINQFPREEMLKLKDEPGYLPGTVIDSLT